MIAEDGYQNFATRKLAQRAEVSEGLIFKYYDSITLLQQIIVDRALRTLFSKREVNEIPTHSNPKAQLISHLSYFLEKASDNRIDWLLFHRTRNERSDILGSMNFVLEESHFYKELHKLIRTLIDGRIEADQFVMDMVIGTLFYTLERTQQQAATIQPISYATLLVHTISEGLLSS